LKLLITGALGHIGSSLIRYLPNKNINISKIYLIDNLLSQRYISLFDLNKNIKFKFLDIDLANCDINKIPKSDVTIHLGAKTDAAQSAKFKKEFLSNNLNSTKNLINYCNLKKSKLIFASSTSIYGPQSTTVDEQCIRRDLNPQSPYASIKLREERLISKELLNSSYIILRLGTICGFSPGIRFHTAVNKFCFQASTDQPLTIWKTALNQRRPYLTLEDFNRSILFLLKKDYIKNDIFNLVSNNLTVKEILKLISKYVHFKKTYVSHEIMNQLSYNVSTKKFKKLGFNFKSNIDNAISETLKRI